jgi:hypothetical protein
MTTDNLNILAIAAPESNMARQRAHRKNGNKGGLQVRKLPLSDITNGITVRVKNNNTGKGIYNKDLMPDLTSTQCSNINESNKLNEIDLNKKIKYNENKNINNTNNSNTNCDGDDDDDDDDDDDVEINPECDEGKENFVCLNNTPRQETRPDLMIPSPLGDMSMNDTSDFTTTSRSDYLDHCGRNGLVNHTSLGDLRKIIENIIKDITWPEYKIPDKYDYSYMSDFSKLVLVNIHKKFGVVTMESTDLWVQVMPILKMEYQIMRSTITQAMKAVLLCKYENFFYIK